MRFGEGKGIFDQPGRNEFFKRLQRGKGEWYCEEEKVLS
jgi:hypothetical protein